jgi:hypothetical protein
MDRDQLTDTVEALGHSPEAAIDGTLALASTSCAAGPTTTTSTSSRTGRRSSSGPTRHRTRLLGSAFSVRVSRAKWRSERWEGRCVAFGMVRCLRAPF